MRLLSSLTIATVLCSSLTAQTLIIPANVDATTEGSSSTGWPFDRGAGHLRIQYAYDASNFAGVGMPILINRLRFRVNGGASCTGATITNFTVRLGEASVDHNSMTTTFAANYARGVEPPLAYSGSVTIQAVSASTPGPWYVDIPLTSSVLYDPTSGNDFLLEMAYDGSFSGDSAASDNGGAGSQTHRIYNLTDWQSATGSLWSGEVAIVCELVYTPATGLYANFTADRATAGPGEVVSFTDTSFTSDPGGITSWAWDFDGDAVPDSTVQNPTWAFAACGPRDVTLTVTDATGTNAITKSGIVDIAAPAASFTATPPSGAAPLVVQFTDTSSNLPTAWDWDLDGDGVFGDSTMQNPVWGYPFEGLYTVSLVASNACGSSTAATTTIDTRSGLCTTFAGGNGLGNDVTMFFDANVTEPSGLTVTSLDVHNSSAGASLTVTVYTTPNTYAGVDDVPSAWTMVGSGSAISNGEGVPTPLDVSDFCLAPGAYGIALHYQSSAGTNRYTTGANTYSNAELTLTLGRSRVGLFSGGFNDPRTWNGCIFYSVGITPGTYTQIGTGCPNSTGSVADLNLQGGAVPTYGQVMTFEVSNAPANEPLSFVMFGFYDVGGVDLGVIGMPGCPLHADGVVSLNAPTNALGIGTVNLGIPSQPSQFGATFYTQPFVKDLGTNLFGAVTGNAKRGVVGCP